jgi:undecaprenyl-diphosphatase
VIRWPRGVLAVAAVAFVVLTIAAILVGTAGVDTDIRNQILMRATPGMVSVMRVINVAGDWKFLVPATLALLLVFGRLRVVPKLVFTKDAWVWIALMVAAPIAEGLLKIAVARSRPESAAYGFPSGHATAAAAYFGALVYLATDLRARRRAVVRVAAVAMMLLVAVARVMLRAHWPSDVLGGLALGLALASAATVIASRTADRPDRGSAST